MKYNDNGTYEDIVIKAVAPGRNSYSSSTSEVYSCDYTNKLIKPITTYSETEQVVGTWIDGKPIYRKVVQKNTTINAGNNRVTHGISNLETLVNVYGTIYFTNSSEQTPLTSSSPNAMNWSCAVSGVSSTEFNISAGSSLSNAGATVTITLEYTKTTD